MTKICYVDKWDIVEQVEQENRQALEYISENAEEALEWAQQRLNDL